MSNFTVTATKKPTIKGKSLFFKATLLDTDQTIDAVAFFKDIDTMPEFKNALMSLDTGVNISFSGRQKINNYNGKEEIIIEGPAKERTVQHVEIKPLQERTLPDAKYSFLRPGTKVQESFWSDGIYAWKEGHKDKKVKINYDFIAKYNSYVTVKDYLLPDWFVVEQANRLESEKNLLEEYAIY